MPTMVPFRSVAGAKESYLRLRSTIKSLRERSKEQLMSIARTGEAGLTGAVAGLMNGYFNNPQIGPVPIDAGLGGVLKLGAFVLEGDASEHVHALADGFLIAAISRGTTNLGIQASADQNGVDPATILTRRAAGLNDDGTAPGSEGDHPGAG